MYNNRIQYAMDYFIVDDYFLPENRYYELKEKDKNGKSLLRLTINSTNICVEDYDDKIKCGFLRQEKKHGMKKCIDHFVLKENDNVWDLYMFEMKTGVGNKTRRDIKVKLRASYLNIKALCGFLGITIGEVYAYTTYETEHFTGARNSADPKTILAPLGERAIDFKKDEWNRGRILIELGENLTLPHIAIQMERHDAIGLVGELQI
ncbi:hypothetical protein DV702_08710 [Sporosarcina sp. PTS2304]|uniref:hypothetical protein n=1 Tax=Sporosarcina sp. PTS2304 TaxID=2283194 RepID=UPI000E0DFD8E|nr:hypothetical protein [Sporosarcina sp. PTS2304]AXH99807.1 hypothetical protein DV702_08710 [Sporosarcina sp. PTS2304]